MTQAKWNMNEYGTHIPGRVQAEVFDSVVSRRGLLNASTESWSTLR